MKNLLKSKMGIYYGVVVIILILGLIVGSGTEEHSWTSQDPKSFSYSAGLDLDDFCDGCYEHKIGWFSSRFYSTYENFIEEGEIKVVQDDYTWSRIDSGQIILVIVLFVILFVLPFAIKGTKVLFEKQKKAKDDRLKSVISAATEGNKENNLSEKMKELNEMKNSGLITEEEYEVKRKELLSKI